MEGLTASDRDEKLAKLKLLADTDAGTGFLHEGVYKNDPQKFTREWFSRANSLFAELALDCCACN